MNANNSGSRERDNLIYLNGNTISNPQSKPTSQSHGRMRQIQKSSDRSKNKDMVRNGVASKRILINDQVQMQQRTITSMISQRSQTKQRQDHSRQLKSQLNKDLNLEVIRKDIKGRSTVKKQTPLEIQNSVVIADYNSANRSIDKELYIKSSYHSQNEASNENTSKTGVLNQHSRQTKMTMDHSINHEEGKTLIADQKSRSIVSSHVLSQDKIKIKHASKSSLNRFSHEVSPTQAREEETGEYFGKKTQQDDGVYIDTKVMKSCSNTSDRSNEDKNHAQTRQSIQARELQQKSS